MWIYSVTKGSIFLYTIHDLHSSSVNTMSNAPGVFGHSRFLCILFCTLLPQYSRSIDKWSNNIVNWLEECDQLYD